MEILHVVGNRPQFIKLGPLVKELKKRKAVKNIIVHTGQHYDFRMSKIFFKELNIREPDYNLQVGSGSGAEQTAKVISGLEKILVKKNPDIVLVYGDTNSTLGGALAAAKLNIPLAKIEAGNRLAVLKTQEEVNRRVIDHISDFLFVPSVFEKENLVKEGIQKDRIFLVGNIMADALIKYKDKIKGKKSNYAVLTLHRAETVDNRKTLVNILHAIEKIGKRIDIIFPVHPRTKKRIAEFNLKIKNIKTIQPIPYLEMLSLMKNSKFVMTDSGGIQSETTILKVPCLTLKQDTEWPITTRQGTNLVAGINKDQITRQAQKVLERKSEIYKRKIKTPRLWDGRTSQRIIKVLLNKP